MRITKTQHHTIGLLGGTGFVGQHLCAALISAGYEVRVFTRRPESHKELKVLPGLQLVKVDVMDQTQLRHAIDGCDVIINLVGILNEAGRNGSGFHNVHVDLVHRLIFACKEKHVKRILQLSALNADKDKGPSHYLQSKGEADVLLTAAQSEQMNVTIFRPSVIFGPGDSFLKRFEHLLQISPFIFPLPLSYSVYSPVYVCDVVNAIMASLEDPKTYGQTYNLCGPKVYSLLELVRMIAKTSKFNRLILPLGPRLSKFAARCLECFPGKPLSVDNYKSASVPNVSTSGNSLVDFFKISPRSVESMLGDSVGPEQFKSDFQRIYIRRAKRLIRG